MNDSDLARGVHGTYSPMLPVHVLSRCLDYEATLRMVGKSLLDSRAIRSAAPCSAPPVGRFECASTDSGEQNGSGLLSARSNSSEPAVWSCAHSLPFR